MLVLPKKITIQLKDQNKSDLKIKNIIISINTKSTLKNNIELFPFISDKNGTFNITKELLIKNIEKTINGGLMDYAPIETAYPTIKILVIDKTDILNRIEVLKKEINNVEGNVKQLKEMKNSEEYSSLLKDSKGILEELKERLIVYDNSYNKRNILNVEPIIDVWDKEQVVYYSLIINT